MTPTNTGIIAPRKENTKPQEYEALSEMISEVMIMKMMMPTVARKPGNGEKKEEKNRKENSILHKILKKKKKIIYDHRANLQFQA